MPHKTYNNQSSFFFYDYETFGIDPAKDRISQFGGIRTDMALNVIDDPVTLYCQQSPDYLPHPEAVLITGITPQLCQKKGMPEPEFASHIYDQFSVANTCVLGYNSIRFDDEMTRYLFYRNFFDPYAHTWKNNNSRWDLIDLVRACYALRPEGIIWPMDENNLPSFKLESLTQANHIPHAAAHDALSDVYATIAIAKLIKQKQPKLFEYFFNNRRAKSLIGMIDLTNLTPLVHVSGMFGAARSNCSIIAPICYQPANKNALICVDLMGDFNPLIELPATEIQKKLYTATADLTENEARIPLKSIHLNKCPILADIKTLPKNRQSLDINQEKYSRNHELLVTHRSMITQKVLAIFNTSHTYPEAEAEGRLYEGFLTPQDAINVAKLRILPPAQLANHGFYFEDSRIEDLIFLYRAKHFPDSLSASELHQWQSLCQVRLENQKPQFLEALNLAKQNHADHAEKQKLLLELESYSMKLFNEIIQ